MRLQLLPIVDFCRIIYTNIPRRFHHISKNRKQILTFKVPTTTDVVCFGHLLKYFSSFLTNGVGLDLTDLDPHCLTPLPLHTYVKSNNVFKNAADDLSRQHFEVKFYRGLDKLDNENEQRHEISNNVVCTISKGSDQPTRSLITAFASCLNILLLLSYCLTSFGVSKLKRRLHRLV